MSEASGRAQRGTERRTAVVDGTRAMAPDRVPWDVPAYLARARATCFVCEMLAGTPGYDHEVVHRDAESVAFLARYPVVRGHLLVAPTAHREHIVADIGEEEHARLQRVVHRIGRALTAVVVTERLYVLSLGSQQANRHIHWHLVPQPPGLPYEEQQTALFEPDRGWLDLPPEETAQIAAAVRDALGSP
jgi:diadenosine tetraphosphate (Ap4A) HIT family hydrolase